MLVVWQQQLNFVEEVHEVILGHGRALVQVVKHLEISSQHLEVGVQYFVELIQAPVLAYLSSFANVGLEHSQDNEGGGASVQQMVDLLHFVATAQEVALTIIQTVQSNWLLLHLLDVWLNEDELTFQKVLL